ncbi:MAG: hypothetical protein ACRD1Z_06630, partial [Vicinamibacteria bacterium]
TRAGTLRNLRIRHTSIPFATPYTVFKNGVATAIVATVPVSGVTGTDLVNTAAVLAGDTIEIQGDGVNGPLAATAVLQLD